MKTLTGFTHLTPREEALDTWLSGIVPLERHDTLPLTQASGRTLAEGIQAPHPLPEFRRSTMDGFAVRASDTVQAPLQMKLAPEVRMGSNPTESLSVGSAARIHTGAMLPPASDAVVIQENTALNEDGTLTVYATVHEGENTIAIGEDVLKGETILRKGDILTPARLGGLSAFGFTEVKTAIPPRVALVSGGDELVGPGQPTRLGQIRDINTVSLAACLRIWGAEPVTYPIVKDRYSDLLQTVQQAFAECDVVVITAGSSLGERDLTAQVISALGSPGILVHGIAIKPGKPAILARCKGKAVLGLPGNPVSALVVAWLFLRPLITLLLGGTPRHLPHPIQGTLTRAVESIAGREDWVPVRLGDSPAGLTVQPLQFKSNLIFTLANADGILHIPAAWPTAPENQIVDVYPIP